MIMKILVASYLYELSSKIKHYLNDLDVELTVVKSVDEVLQALSETHYDFLFTEYAICDTDIWKLSTLIQSSRFNDYSIPLYLIQENGDTDIPPMLSNEYRFKVIGLDQIKEVLECPLSTNDYKPTLLIIEDEPDAANIAFHALNDNYVIDIAIDGELGYEKWLEKRHDLILLDLMLPKLSGDRVLEKILEIEADQPVIVVTAFSDTDNQKKMMINGASEFLPKPYSLIELRKLCQLVCSRSRLASEIHYREDKLKRLSDLLWLWNQHMSKNNYTESMLVMQRIQSIVPVVDPSDDEQYQLLQSVI